MPFKRQNCLSFLLLILFLAACTTVPEPTATLVVIAVDEATATAPAIPTAISATATIAQPPTLTPPSTDTPTRLASPAPSVTTTVVSPTQTITPTIAPAQPVTPTASLTPATTGEAAVTVTAPPAPITNLEQPPYAPSACSDKYPCNEDVAAWEARIRVPPGFRATYFARVSGQPTALTFGPDGLLYVSQMNGAIVRINSSGNVSPYVSGLMVPTGLTFQPGTSKLYVSSRLVNQSIGGEAQVAVVEGGAARTIIRGLPCCYTGYHSANGIAFGPDGFGYVSVGARADHGEILEDGPNKGQQDELHPLEAAILRFSPDGSVVEVYARGFRNAYGIAWDGNGRLFATDNGPDGDPGAGLHFPDLLHRVVPGREHGYPWYDCPVCFSAPPDVQIVEPIYRFAPHVAATGITAYQGSQFPGYQNNLFVTLWTALPFAQRVMRFGPGGSGASTFVTGLAAPIDVTVGPEGSLYVADWATGIIFKISYGQ